MKVLVIQNKRCESLGSLDGLFDYDLIEADEGEDIPSLKGYDGLVILGGPASAYDDLKYLRDEELLIKDAIKNNIPTLGICLGSQLIAKACNARVYKGSKEEIGWYEVNLHNSLANAFNTDKLIVFQWHNDTFDLPDNAELLASSQLYNQAFRIGSAVAIQFHLEVTEQMIYEWMDEYNTYIDSKLKPNTSLARQLWNYVLNSNASQ
ncbi:MAG: hypothetical protein KatS3mg003_1406 [Candidatus Nitrosocaldaceae archaeon]|nr:MAG: hypothetical protein KatS3mg003_1406 [Candidatus Nitrosocaldaceae archaeon]